MRASNGCAFATAAMIVGASNSKLNIRSNIWAPRRLPAHTHALAAFRPAGVDPHSLIVAIDDLGGRVNLVGLCQGRLVLGYGSGALSDKERAGSRLIAQRHARRRRPQEAHGMVRRRNGVLRHRVLALRKDLERTRVGANA